MAREQCRREAPALFFASHLLSRGDRHALYCIHAVLRQLQQIMTSGAAAGPGAATCDAPGTDGCGGCGGESLERRREVCRAVIDFLYAGSRSGKPELDGFHDVARERQLPRELLERFVDGLEAMAGSRRYATWKRLREHCERTAGVVGELSFIALAGPGYAREGAAVRSQVLALSTAMHLTVLVARLPRAWRCGRLTLPLDDLVKSGMSERHVTALVEAGAAAGDPLWRRLMELEWSRAQNLYRGGVGSLAALPPAPRRAMAVFAAFQRETLRGIVLARVDPFAREVHPFAWRRLRALSVALRWVQERPSPQTR